MILSFCYHDHHDHVHGKTLDIKPIKNLLKFDLIYKFLKSQIETCYIFGPTAIVKAILETQLVWCLFQQNY